MPVQDEHLVFSRSDWLDNNNVGPINVKKSLQKNRITNKNFEGLYLSPGHPNVNKYLIRVFKN